MKRHAHALRRAARRLRRTARDRSCAGVPYGKTGEVERCLAM